METLVELGGLVVGLLLTLFVLSYVIGDNPLYRLSVHILVGVSAAFAAIMIIREVFAPILTSIRGESETSMGVFWLIPLTLALLLLLKVSPRLAWLGNSAMASLVGTGAAVGLVGAVAGTLLPQVLVQYENRWLALIIALLTILTLAYFFFTGQVGLDGRVVMPRWYPVTAKAGRIVITITLAGLFVAVINTSLILLIQRIAFYSDEIARMIDSLAS